MTVEVFSYRNGTATDFGAVENEKGLAEANPLNFLAPRPGLEPGTCGLTVRRSTD